VKPIRHFEIFDAWTWKCEERGESSKQLSDGTRSSAQKLALVFLKVCNWKSHKKMTCHSPGRWPHFLINSLHECRKFIFTDEVEVAPVVRGNDENRSPKAKTLFQMAFFRIFLWELVLVANAGCSVAYLVYARIKETLLLFGASLGAFQGEI